MSRWVLSTEECRCTSLIKNMKLYRTGKVETLSRVLCVKMQSLTCREFRFFSEFLKLTLKLLFMNEKEMKMGEDVGGGKAVWRKSSDGYAVQKENSTRFSFNRQVESLSDVLRKLIVHYKINGKNYMSYYQDVI